MQHRTHPKIPNTIPIPTPSTSTNIADGSSQTTYYEAPQLDILPPNTALNYNIQDCYERRNILTTTTQDMKPFKQIQSWDSKYLKQGQPIYNTFGTLKWAITIIDWSLINTLIYSTTLSCVLTKEAMPRTARRDWSWHTKGAFVTSPPGNNITSYNYCK